MNENNVIVRDFERPSAELVERFKGIPVANLDDCMERRAAVHSSIKPVGYRGPMVGTAFTIRVPEGDNLMLHAAMEYMKPGDVVVLDAGGYTERAIFGELMAAYMYKESFTKYNMGYGSAIAGGMFILITAIAGLLMFLMNRKGDKE